MDQLEKHYWARLMDAMRPDIIRAASGKADTSLEPPIPPLRKRISDWYCAMKWDTGRCQGYTMQQLSEIFDTPPNVLGPLLTDMGWVRKRDWSGGRATRYWVNEPDCRFQGRMPTKPCYDTTPQGNGESSPYDS